MNVYVGDSAERRRLEAERARRPAAPRERLGLLGGGQLALMLAQAVRRAGAEPVVLAASPDDPAVQAGLPHEIGRLDDPEALDRLFARVDVVTIENEFLDVPVLEAAVARRPGVRFHPRLPTIALVQDKLRQKSLFRRLAIPTADFEVVAGRPDEAEVRRLLRRFPDGFVLKWSRFGYDGRGNFVVKPEDVASIVALQHFCARGRDAGAEIYAEERIDFAHEVAMVVARGADGTQRSFPLVTTRQERGVCREVLGPASALDLPARLEEEARAWLGLLADELDFVGAFAVELFVEPGGRMLVNEMAPRVHNSGHYTLWADETSQFDLHVQAVLGRGLARPTTAGEIVLMRNVLGPHDLVGKILCPTPAQIPPADTDLVWYGKTVASRGRKMGHLTGRAVSPEAARRLAAQMAAWEERYWALLGTREQPGPNEEPGRREKLGRSEKPGVKEESIHVERGRARRHRDGVVVGLARDEGGSRRAG